MMKVGYNLVINTYVGDMDAWDQNIKTFKEEKDAIFWAYVMSSFTKSPEKVKKDDFKKFLESVSAPVQYDDSKNRMVTVIEEIISAAILHLDYVPEEFKKSFLKGKLESEKGASDICRDILSNYVGIDEYGSVNNIDRVRIIYIGELKEIYF